MEIVVLDDLEEVVFFEILTSNSKLIKKLGNFKCFLEFNLEEMLCHRNALVGRFTVFSIENQIFKVAAEIRLLSLVVSGRRKVN